MPGAAAGLPDVGAVDPQPLEASRVGEHLLEQPAIFGLVALAGAERAARLCDPVGEIVADRLEPTEIEDAGRPGDRPSIPARLGGAWEGLCEKAGELPLQPHDLPTQLGAGEVLAIGDPELGAGVSFEELRHAHRV
jgi:hypothetical protein